MAPAARAQPWAGDPADAGADGSLRSEHGRIGYGGAYVQAARKGAGGVSVEPQISIAVDGADNDVVVARITGEIDLASADTVGGELASAVPNRALGLVLDLSGTSYLDSSGVSLIFELAERLRRRQQQLQLVVPRDAPLLRVLRIVKAADVVPITGSVDEAAAQIRAGL